MFTAPSILNNYRMECFFRFLLSYHSLGVISGFAPILRKIFPSIKPHFLPIFAFFYFCTIHIIKFLVK